MLVPFRDIQGSSLRTSSGTIGRVHNFYVGYSDWSIRFLTVDIGPWFSSYSVLLPASVLKEFDFANGTIAVTASRLQIELSPPVKSNQPLADGMPGIDTGFKGIERVNGADEDRQNGSSPEDPNVYSSEQLQKNYTVRISNSYFGSVDNFIVEYGGKWSLRYLIIQTSWWPAKRILLPREYVVGISRTRYELITNLRGNMLDEAPEYNPAAPIDPGWEKSLQDYYARLLTREPNSPARVLNGR